MSINASLQANATIKTMLTISGQQLMGLKLLAKSLPELRAEVVHEIETNPALEDVDHPLEKNMSEIEHERGEVDNGDNSGLPEDDFTPLSVRYDEDAIERRQAMFDNQTAVETLQEHLIAQLPFSEIPAADFTIAETLIGDLDANGYYRGSIPDICMAFNRDEDSILAILKAIAELDPLGCGTRTARECLRAQLECIPDRGDLRAQTAYLIDHLEDLAAGNIDVTHYAEAIKALKTLEPHPGKAYPSEKDRIEYINPEIHTYRDEAGHWCAATDKRSLPEIRISKRFESMLADPQQTAETKAYIRERIEHARAIREAVAKRQETIESIAQAIYDRQQDFFVNGMTALKPMTEQEIAKQIGVASTTVSRTVRDKYAKTPKGTIELRRFFTSGVRNAAGESVSQNAVLECLRNIIDAEDKSNPLSDEHLATMMKNAGFPIARRTVAKYRGKLDIPDAASRRT